MQYQKALKLINQIQFIRKRNNVNWMDVLRLTFIHAPDEAKKLMKKINQEDNKISKLFEKPFGNKISFGSKDSIKDKDINYNIENFYMTDAISRASETMAICTKEILNKVS